MKDFSDVQMICLDGINKTVNYFTNMVGKRIDVRDKSFKFPKKIILIVRLYLIMRVQKENVEIFCWLSFDGSAHEFCIYPLETFLLTKLHKYEIELF